MSDLPGEEVQCLFCGGKGTVFVYPEYLTPCRACGNQPEYYSSDEGYCWYACPECSASGDRRTVTREAAALNWRQANELFPTTPK